MLAHRGQNGLGPESLEHDFPNLALLGGRLAAFLGLLQALVDGTGGLPELLLEAGSPHHLGGEAALVRRLHRAQSGQQNERQSERRKTGP